MKQNLLDLIKNCPIHTNEKLNKKSPRSKVYCCGLCNSYSYVTISKNKLIDCQFHFEDYHITYFEEEYIWLTESVGYVHFERGKVNYTSDENIIKGLYDFGLKIKKLYLLS